MLSLRTTRPVPHPRLLEQRALTAACAVATAHDLPCEQAAVVHSASNVLVHLRPAPVVARVMTGTVVLHDDPRRWLEREVSVVSFLAESGLAVAPSELIPGGPFCQDGLWMTFTQWVAHENRSQPGDHDPAELGRCLRRLHDELLGFAGDLGDLSDVRDDIERLLGLLRPTPAVNGQMIGSLRERLSALDWAFRSSRPAQALHGDVSLSNLFRTAQRYVWNDFEDTFRGPVEWDVAGLAESLRGRGADPRFVRRALDGYGWGDEAELAPFIAAQETYYKIWALYDAQRRTAADS